VSVAFPVVNRSMPPEFDLLRERAANDCKSARGGRVDDHEQCPAAHDNFVIQRSGCCACAITDVTIGA